MLHETLWQQNTDLAEACLNHPFVCRLADGTLDCEAFKRYVAQDTFFLKAFGGAYAITAARMSHNRDYVRALHKLMGGVLEELQLHASYSERLGIDLEHVVPYPATTAYTDFLLSTAWHRSPSETVAAMVPCMKLYVFLGASLRHRSQSGHPYRDWIETYSSDDFSRLSGELEFLLDKFAADGPAVRDAYRYAMQCELGFFSAPLLED